MRPANGILPAMRVAVYIHVPFCRRRCRYCDFATWAALEGLIPAYLGAVRAELSRLRQWADWKAGTVYFGGGTPSLLKGHQVGRLLAQIQLTPDLEVSLEANPGTVGRPELEALHRAGVNRLSLGMQSGNERELRMLGRAHTHQAVVDAVRDARAAGVGNLNLDLMYGLPGQGRRQWKRSLDAALALQPEHLSLYALSVEPGTPLSDDIESGRIVGPDPDRAADLYDQACEVLMREGFEHYEVSNWARPGKACLHNLAYWRNDAYLGVGAAAVGHWPVDQAGWRLRNVRHPQEYVARLQPGVEVDASELPISPATDEREYVPADWAMAETMFMGLRLLEEGVERDRFRRRFGRDAVDVYTAPLSELHRAGLITWDDRRLRLTPRAVMTANQVFEAFLPEAPVRDVGP
jgi:oxygen-independent coproporphyrinogen-3 oxidase